MRRALATTLLVLVLTGCRETLVEPMPDPIAPAPPSNVRQIYLKGPDFLSVSATGHYRGEPLREAARYTWSVYGDGRVAGAAEDEIGRLQEFRALGAGAVTLVVEARDASNRVLGVGQKEVTIVR